ncbi:hypothetical protein GWK47_003343 [Chionoecetes opilio]|uniref:HAT C-terminal dimerisation domain-containing protein n=1 Tax=Chionoecetes opilio TaxID=41210 RepID=A0A8J4Z4L1_CHIOP|nr:hypothetical protein GWK47_003343 [Chionoecetes opilio]
MALAPKDSPSLVTGEGVEKLLGVPNCTPELVDAAATAVFEALEDGGGPGTTAGVVKNLEKCQPSTVLIVRNRDLRPAFGSNRGFPSYAPANDLGFAKDILQYHTKLFDIKTDFLSANPRKWQEEKNRTSGPLPRRIEGLRVVNDTAEREGALIQSFNLRLTKDEEQRQFLLQVVGAPIAINSPGPRRLPSPAKPATMRKGDRQDCNNYRGITLLSVPGKVLAHLLLTRIRSHLVKHQRPQQSGFTPGKSTTDRILALRVLVERRRNFLLSRWSPGERLSRPARGGKPLGLEVSWLKTKVQVFGDLLDEAVQVVPGARRQAELGEVLTKAMDSWEQVHSDDPITKVDFPSVHREASAAVERLFSSGGDILRAKRSALTAYNFEQLVFLKGSLGRVLLDKKEEEGQADDKEEEQQLEEMQQ